jgi:hypothetical protein
MKPLMAPITITVTIRLFGSGEDINEVCEAVEDAVSPTLGRGETMFIDIYDARENDNA